MDTTSMYIGLAVLAIVALPLYFVLKGRNIDQKQISSLFEKHSRDNYYRFELVASSNRKVLGIDTAKKGLIFIDFNLKEPFVSFQNLQENGSCEVAISNASVRSNAPERIEWIFMSKNGKPTENSVVFHDSDKNYIVPVYAHEELKLAQSWKKTIQSYI